MAEKGPLQEITGKETEIVLTGGDLILDHLTGKEDAEKTPDKERKNTEIVIASIRKAREGTGIVQDPDKRSTEREDRADQTHRESDYISKTEA